MSDSLLQQKKDFLELERIARFGPVGLWKELVALFTYGWWGAVLGGIAAFFRGFNIIY